MINHEMTHGVRALRQLRVPVEANRVHQVAGGVRAQLPDQLDFRQRRTIEMIDAGAMKGLDHDRIVIRFDRVQDAPRKTVNEMSGGFVVDMRIDAIHGQLRLPRFK